MTHRSPACPATCRWDGRELRSRSALPVVDRGRLLHKFGEWHIERSGDPEQVRVLDADAGLDALDGGPPEFRLLGELLLGEAGVLAGLANAVALLLAGEALPFGLDVGHPSTLLC